MTTAVRWIVVVVLVLHGAVHLLGAAKGFGWAEVTSLRHAIGPTAAAMWLLAAVLVLSAAVMIAARAPTWWWAGALLAAVVSEGVILSDWSDAKAGTVANVVLVVAAAYGFLSVGPVSLPNEWEVRAEAALAAAPSTGAVVTESDLAGLPGPVATYVRRSGAVGRPHVVSFYAEVHGRIRSGPGQPWMRFTGRQLNTFGRTPQRVFLLDATRSGLPVTVLHVFDDRGATMRGRLLGLLPILDAKGPEMDRSETVTLFNDLVVLAPGALVDAPVRWTPLTDSRVRGTFTRADQSVSADLVFGPDGDLVDFVSDDRSRASSDGSSFTRLRWNTPLTRYGDLHGRRVAVEGTGMWGAPAPEGHFSYIDFHVDDLAYNVSAPAMPEDAGSVAARALDRAERRS